jgi:uncharacterized damage-inducible protein DinB
MSISAFKDAIEHHIWATEVVIDACAKLSPAQLEAPCVGTFGPIIETLRHLVQADSWYLFVITKGQVKSIDEDAKLTLAQLKAAMWSHAEAWRALLTDDPDAEADTVVAEEGDGWEFHAPLGFRLAQVVHHGTDHRSQIATALTSLEIQPPEIDLWAYGDVRGRTREIRTAAV